MTRSFATASGAALMAAGLLALTPATAYAHTPNAYVLSVDRMPSVISTDAPTTELRDLVGDFRFAAVDRTDASMARLPAVLSDGLGFITLGLEIVEDQGYALGGSNTILDDLGSVPAFLYQWDHTTGANDEASVLPLHLAEEHFAAGGVFEEHPEARILVAYELDAQPDGTLLTAVIVRDWSDTAPDRNFLFIGSIDVEDERGEVTLLTAVNPAAFTAFAVSVSGIATNPTDGATYVILDLVDLEAASIYPAIAKVDLDPGDLTLVAGVFDAATRTFAVEEAEDVEAAAVELAKFAPLSLDSSIAHEEYNFVAGADFDDTGKLWFVTLSGTPDEELDGAFTPTALLNSIAARFAIDTTAVPAGELLMAADDQPGYFPGIIMPQPVFAIDSGAEDDAELAATGVSATLAPLAALAAAIAGGALLLFGRRRARTTSA